MAEFLVMLTLLAISNVIAFDLKCPLELERTFRKNIVCTNNTVDRYSCLLDQDSSVYRESCTDSADYVRPGQKYVTSGRRKNIDCSPMKYQPFKFWSHTLSQCVFDKSSCKELGQILNWNGSSMVDSTCRCDYTAGYGFVNEPSNRCFCRPTEEDCMCYVVSCPEKMQITQDYKCSSREDIPSSFKCPSIIKTTVETDASYSMKAEENITTGKLWTKILITCFIIIAAIILLTVLTKIIFSERQVAQKSTTIESKNVRQTCLGSSAEAVEKLCVIIVSLKQLLTNKDFNKDFEEEMSAVCPNYMHVLEIYERELLRDDCGIIIAGDTSAGKTTLINQLVEKDVFYTSNLAATGSVCRIRNSESLSINGYDKDNNLIDKKTAVDLPELASLIKQYTAIGRNRSKLVDVYLPVSILKGNVILVDTPGIGANDNLDTILLDFLPQAVSFVFIVDASNAGGIQHDRLLKILKTVIAHRMEMPCFEPDEAIFLTNKWDIIENEKEVEDTEDSHTKTMHLIQSKLSEGWPGFNTDRVFKVSLKQVRKSKKTDFTAQFTKFKSILCESIEKNKNKRFDYYFRFVQMFAINAERGIASRIHLLNKSDNDRKKSISKYSRMVIRLEELSHKNIKEINDCKIELVGTLAENLSRYLDSKIGRKSILNPHGSTPICFVKTKDLKEEVISRIEIGINRWCEGETVLKVIKEIEHRMKPFFAELQSMIDDIETDITGFTRSIQRSSFSIFTRSSLRMTLLNHGISVIENFRIWCKPSDIRDIYRSISKGKKANEMYEACVSSYTDEHIQTCFEENFGSECDRVIARIFEHEIPQKIDGFKVTIKKLNEEITDNKKKSKSFKQLNRLVQDINSKIANLNELVQKM